MTQQLVVLGYASLLASNRAAQGTTGAVFFGAYGLGMLLH